MDAEEETLRSQITWEKASANLHYLRRNGAFPYYVLDRHRDGDEHFWSVTRMGRARESIGTKTRLADARRLAEDTFVSMMHSRHEVDRLMAETGLTTANVITELQASVRALTLRVTELETERNDDNA